MTTHNLDTCAVLALLYFLTLRFPRYVKDKATSLLRFDMLKVRAAPPP
jgi:hypothetical protein